MKSKILKGRRGFTLIEIIVVLIIIGILAAIALPAYFSWIRKGHVAEALASLETYKNEVEVCVQAHVGSESVCDNLFSPRPTSAYFVYGFPINVTGVAPTDNDPDFVLFASELAEQPPGNFSPYGYTGDAILFLRTGETTTNPTTTCMGTGFWRGIC